MDTENRTAWHDGRTQPAAKSIAKPETELVFDTSFRFDGGEGIKFDSREALDHEAQFAAKLLMTNGILMGTPDGEDSTGRAKSAVMPVGELVERALDIATTFYAKARERGLVLLAPPTAVARDTLERLREAEDDRKEAARRARHEERRRPAEQRIAEPTSETVSSGSDR